MIYKNLFAFIDRKVTQFIMKNIVIFPTRWKKFISLYYPDAVVRKEAWKELNVFMGDHSYANLGFKVLNNNEADTRVSIGKFVSIAANVTLVTDSQPNNSQLLLSIPEVRDHMVKQKPITIEDHVWIGAGVIVLPGITIHEGAIIGAGAVVIEDVPKYSVAVGVPARIIRRIEAAR